MTNLLPLVLVPGLLCTADLFRSQIGALRDHEVMVADTLSDDSIGGMARRLLAAAPDRFVLCGLSMGGYVALEVARTAPERIDRLVLLATSARPDAPEQTATRRRLMRMAEDEGVARVADLLNDRLFGSRAAADRDLRRRSIAMAEAVGTEAFLRQQEAIIARPDQRTVLPAIQIPTTIVVGTEDRIIDPECSREMSAAMPRETLVRLQGVGHMISMEKPDAATEVLRRALGA